MGYFGTGLARFAMCVWTVIVGISVQDKMKKRLKKRSVHLVQGGVSCGKPVIAERVIRRSWLFLWLAEHSANRSL
jgi:hypothetical protein